ncbi:hypothetical protein C8R47DRAFT_1327396 [Mycena vitilis]|nr:hypothetical protein C8R47DRAFT_1327396 [Mycena vitilis]
MTILLTCLASEVGVRAGYHHEPGRGVIPVPLQVPQQTAWSYEIEWLLFTFTRPEERTDKIDALDGTGHTLQIKRWEQISSAYEKLADARLFNEYAPTRDRSEGPTGSVFTYKSMAYEDQPRPGARGSLDLYTPMIFGEAVELEGINPAKLRIKCPSALKCSIKAEYTKQLKALREPIDHDEEELGGVIDGTWFGGDTKDKGHIYVHFKTGTQYDYDFRRDFNQGEVVAIWASMKRTDREDSGRLHKTYRLESDFWTSAAPAQTDVIGANYTCDLNVGECEFC